MTRFTIVLCVISLAMLFVAYIKGVGVIHGADVVTHMYWATAALTAAGLANFIAIAHLSRAERMIRELRALCERNGIAYGED